MPTGEASFTTAIGQAQLLSPNKTYQVVFTVLFRTNWFPNRFYIYFWCQKLGYYDVDLFPTRIRPPLDHGRLRNPIQSTFLHLGITPFYPTFPISCCLLGLSARSSGVLGGLADPRIASDVHLPDRTSQDVFLSSCSEGRALNRSNR